MRSAYAGAAADRVAGMAPCKDCPDRYPGCGGKCEKYQSWKAKRAKVVRDCHKESWEQSQADAVRRHGMHKTLLRRGDKIGTTGR